MRACAAPACTPHFAVAKTWSQPWGVLWIPYWICAFVQTGVRPSAFLRRFESIAICDCDGGVPFHFTGYNKMPRGGHFIIPGGDEVFPRTMHTHRLRGNRDGSTALCLSRLLVFEPLGSHDTYVRHKFTRHKGRVNLWRCKKPFTFGLWKTCAQDTNETGKNREKQGIFAKNGTFTQLRLEHTRRISLFLPHSAQKIPTKTTGNFLDYIRELSTNNRELYFSPSLTQNEQKHTNITQLWLCGMSVIVYIQPRG